MLGSVGGVPDRRGHIRCRSRHAKESLVTLKQRIDDWAYRHSNGLFYAWVGLFVGVVVVVMVWWPR